MNYIQRLLSKNWDVPGEGTDKTDKTPARKSEDSYGDLPPKPPKPGFGGFGGTYSQVSQDFTTPWPPRPSELACWPIERREQWGRLANQLEDEGVPFPESERTAFRQVKREIVIKESPEIGGSVCRTEPKGLSGNGLPLREP
jgi:hypothetical protein